VAKKTCAKAAKPASSSSRATLPAKPSPAKKAKKKPKKKPVKRKATPAATGPGWPGERKIVPNDYPRLMRLYARGITFGEIAARYKCRINTVTHHFKHHIFPLIQASLGRTLESELLKIDEVERTAWDNYASELPAEEREVVHEQIAQAQELSAGISDEATRNKLYQTLTKIRRRHDSKWIDKVQWAIETRIKMEGHLAPTRIHVDIEEYRVAGMSVAEHMDAMQKHVDDKVLATRARDKQLEKAGVQISRLMDRSPRFLRGGPG